MIPGSPEVQTTRAVAAGADERRRELLALLEKQQRHAAPDPIPPRAGGQAPLPLSFAQERLWVLEQLGLSGTAYNIASALRLRGELDRTVLERAVGALVARHEILRTRFGTESGVPHQIVDPAVEHWSIPLEDLSSAQQAERDQAVAAACEREPERRFDLSGGSLFRLRLLRLAADEHVLLITMHHIIADGWSVGILFSEISTLYAAFAQQLASPLPALPVQYADYALWQRQQQAKGSFHEQLKYWRDRLHGLATLHLPADRQRPLSPSFRGDVVGFAVARGVSAELRRLARREGLTPYMVFLGTLQMLLAIWSGQSDIVVGSPVAGRKHGQTEGLIGFFVNMLVMRQTVDAGQTVRKFLQQVRDTALGAYANQDVPFTHLVAELESERDLSRQPLFQVQLVLQNVPRSELALAGLKIGVLPIEHRTAKFDLSVFIHEEDGGFRGAVEYATELFDAGTMQRFARHFSRLLQQVVADPDVSVRDLDPMDPEERGHVLVTCNATHTDYPAELGVHEPVARFAATNPTATALVFRDETLTYAQLDQRANQVASHLRSRHVDTESVVGLCSERCIELVVGVVGIQRAGAAYLPIDLDYPHSRTHYMLSTAGARIVLGLGRHRDLIATLDPTLVFIALDEPLPHDATLREVTPARLSPRAPAYVIYTSGSTGMPKGVTVSHEAISNRLQWMQSQYPLGATDVVLQKTPVTFDVAVWEILWPLRVGARLVIAEPHAHRDPRTIAELIERQGVTVTHFVPSMLGAFLGANERSACRSLRHVFCSGEALTPALRDAFTAWNSGARLHNLYGPTEAAIDVSFFDCDSGPPGPTVPIGRPIANTQLYVLDSHLAPTPLGIAGELYIAGKGLARGYINRPGVTAASFVASPYGTPGARMYRTGDRARRLPDGNIEFLGRLDGQVKLRGYRIELGEIEAALLACPGVRQAAVMLREDEPGEKRLVAYVAADRRSSDEKAPHDSNARHEVLEAWEHLYDDLYSDGGAGRAPHFAGWNSSFDGEPIPHEQMQEWLQSTIRRIRALNPRQILEIGCGAGLLVQQLAPSCEHYFGTDLSDAAVGALKRWARAQSGFERVELQRLAAHELHAIRDRRFDTVVLNSVVQYFPGHEYLLNVLRDAVALVGEAGKVFIGDVRNLGALRVFHSAVALHAAEDSLELAELRRRVDRAIAQEKELVLAPEFFRALPCLLPVIGDVEIQLKHGSACNELTAYRYDVILHIGPRREVGDLARYVWNVDIRSLDALEKLLRGDKAESSGLKISGIPNPRLAHAARVCRLIESGDGGSTVAALRAELSTTSSEALEIDRLWTLGEAHGFGVRVTWSADAIGCCDVELARESARQLSSTATLPSGKFSEYANDPVAGPIAQKLTAELRDRLRRELPPHMVPASFVIAEQLPVAVHGKIDRAALPPPPHAGRDATARVPAHTPLQAQLLRIWEAVLRCDDPGIDDDFFALGGHSLLAARAAAAIRERFDIGFPLRMLFEAPTVRRLAPRLEVLLQNEGDESAQSLVPQERIDPLPLSYAQEQLWFLDQLGSGGAMYNMPLALCLDGDLNRAALERALTELMRRHEILRTRFVASAGTPSQIIEPPRPFRWWAEEDVRAVTPDRKEPLLRQLMQSIAWAPFDLTCAPLLRAALIRIASEEHVLILTAHHMVADGSSLGLMLRELGVLYGAYARGERSPLAEPVLQYADYALWQRKHLEGARLQSHLQYWKESLSGHGTLQLPTDRARPSVASHRGAMVAVEVDAKLSRALVELGRARRATPYRVLLATFQLFLARISGQRDIIVGSPVSGRHLKATEQVFGLLVNTLPLRTNVVPEESFEKLLARVGRTVLAAHEHQDLPFERLVQEVQPRRDPSRHPVFQVNFTFNDDVGRPELPGLKARLAPLEQQTAKFELTLFLQETPLGFRGAFEYATDLFDRSTLERWAAHFQCLLRAIVADPTRRVDELPLLDSAERDQLIVQRNRTTRWLRTNVGVHDLFFEQAARVPGSVALVHGARTVSYRELQKAVQELALRLVTLGVGPEVVVGLHFDRGVEPVTALLATLQAGGAYLPLDPRLPGDRLAFMARDAGVTIVLTSDRLAERFPATDAIVVPFGEINAFAAPAAAIPVRNRPKSHNLAYVIYTSGSTGTPKGVMISHAGLFNYACYACETYDVASGSGAPVNTPFAFDATVTSLIVPLITGRAVTLLEEGPDELTELAAALRSGAGYSLVKLTPSQLGLLQDLLPAASFENLSLRFVIGGEALLAPSLSRWRERAPGACLINEYGPTETVVGCTSFTVTEAMPGEGAVPIGRPIWNTQVYVLDDALQPAPIGIAGELYVGGVALARGYLNRPGITATKFAANPFAADGSRLYRTGDRARWRSDGQLEFLGRTDRQLKLAGVRIEPAEIEACLLKRAEVAQAVAVADEAANIPQLIAYVVPRAPLDIAALRAALARELPAYLLPKAIVEIEALPLTTNGKLDVAALPRPKPAVGSAGGWGSPAEEILAHLIGDIVGVTRVGRTDNFFALGGHSLLGTRVISAIREVFAVELPLRALFEEPTPEGLARRVEAARRTGKGTVLPPLQVQPRPEHIPVSSAQDRIWLIRKLELAEASAEMPTTLHLSGELDLQALRRAFAELVVRHETLRTRFYVHEGAACQRVDPATVLDLPLIDLSRETPEERDAAYHSHMSELARHFFNLETGPLFRVVLIRLSADEHVLLLRFHHIIFDGWSWGVFARELSVLYDAFSRREARSPLPELPVQYADFAIWQRQWLNGDAFDQQLQYWTTRLASLAPLSLHSDRPRPPMASFVAGRVGLTLTRADTLGATELARKESATLYMVLLAALQILLSRWSGQTDIPVGSPVACRNHRNTEGLIGFFLNTLVMRATLSPAMTFRELLRQVRERTLEAYENQDVPFERLVAELHPKRDRSRQPLFQVFFVLQNLPVKAIEWPGLAIRLSGGQRASTKYDLTVRLAEGPEGLFGGLEYATDLFDAATMDRFAAELSELVAAIVANPDGRLGRLMQMPPREGDEVIHDSLPGVETLEDVALVRNG